MEITYRNMVIIDGTEVEILSLPEDKRIQIGNKVRTEPLLALGHELIRKEPAS